MTSDLAAELAFAASTLGLALPPADESGYPATYRSPDGTRAVHVRRWPDRTDLDVQLRTPGALLAQGWTEDPGEAVRAVVVWLGGAGLEETAAAAPFVRYGDWALAHEREPLDPVELAWWQRLDHVRHPVWRALPHAAAMWEAAHAQPALRRLHPVTSHRMLRFLVPGTQTFEQIGWGIEPQPGGWYQLRTRGGPEIPRTTDLAEAIRLVVASVEGRSVSEKRGGGAPS
ncbi:DUF6193 family natural product biosynthesis protein [Kitasatospora sp. NPDC001664]